ncbi:MAG TPA: hypothetical protein VFA98_11640 [Thermoanaerobaculia bacterium]|jgi:hypothetical protein|nr:hypothetical protein [Thermoanaerobaculia bacterium]
MEKPLTPDQLEALAKELANMARTAGARVLDCTSKLWEGKLTWRRTP